MRLVAGIAAAASGRTLQQFVAQLEAMRERTRAAGRGGTPARSNICWGESETPQFSRARAGTGKPASLGSDHDRALYKRSLRAAGKRRPVSIEGVASQPIRISPGLSPLPRISNATVTHRGSVVMKARHGRRDAVEGMFCRIKNWRCIANRRDQLGKFELDVGLHRPLLPSYPGKSAARAVWQGQKRVNANPSRPPRRMTPKRDGLLSNNSELNSNGYAFERLDVYFYEMLDA